MQTDTRAQIRAMGMLLVLCASTALAVGPVSSENPNSGPAIPPARLPSRVQHLTAQQRIDKRVQQMTRALNLNADQQSQVRRILTEQLQRVQKIRSDPSMQAEDRIGALRAVNQGTAERIRAVLNDEQKNKYSPPPPAQPDAGDPAAGKSPAAPAALSK